MKLVVLCFASVVAVARAQFYFTPAAVPVPSTFGRPLPLQQFYNYRGSLSLAPGQPANIIAADGRPLDTLDVNLDRAAHITAKALENGFHSLKKRSVPGLAVVSGSPAVFATGNIGIATPFGLSPTAISASVATNPIGISAQLAPSSIALSAPISRGPIAAAPIAVPAPNAATPVGIVGSINPVIRVF